MKIKVLKNFVLLGLSVLLIGCGTTTETNGTVKDVHDEKNLEIISSTLIPTNTPVPTNTPAPTPIPNIDLAIKAFNNKDYDEALKYFETVDYSLKKDYLVDIARIYFNDYGEPYKAYEITTLIDEYDQETARNIRNEIKYRWFCYDPYGIAVEASEWGYIESYEIDSDVGMDILSRFYNTWYDYNSGESVEITEFTINGRPYGVEGIYNDSGNEKIIYHYLDNPLETFCMAYTVQRFIIDENTNAIIDGVCDDSMFIPWISSSDLCAYDVTPSEYDEYVAMDKNYINNLIAGITSKNNSSSFTSSTNKTSIYNAAKKEFKKTWIERRYDLVEQVYLTVEYDSVNEATYSYNESMGTHQIRFEVKISENFGVTYQTYVISGEFYEENGQLKASMFNVY